MSSERVDGAKAEEREEPTADVSEEETEQGADGEGTPDPEDRAQESESTTEGQNDDGPLEDDAEDSSEDADKAEEDGEAEENEREEDESDGEAEAAAGGEEDKGTARPIRIRYYGCSDVGLVREHNEDNFIVGDLTGGKRGLENDEPAELVLGKRGAIFSVCDGMGGAAAGEVASQMAVDTLWEFLSGMDEAKDRDQFARRIVSAVTEAGNRIYAAAKMDRTRRGMGTTSTLAGLMDKVLFIGQVGDSRAYLLRKGKLNLITKDQSLVNQLIEAGQLTEEEAEAFEHSNIILQALGTTEEVTVDLTFLELRRGDRLMLCSDGLSGLVHQDLIEDVLSNVGDLTEASAKLIEMANAGGGHDNITVVCADFDGEGLDEPEEMALAVYQQYPLPPGDEEEKESLAPRSMRMKQGGPKPGADVKRPPSSEGAEQAAKATSAVGPFGWGTIIVVLLLVVFALLATLMSSGGESEEDSEAVTGTESHPLEQGSDLASVRVRVDADGELRVDQRPMGKFEAGEERVVEVAPGARTFELHGEGGVIASIVVSVDVDAPNKVVLSMPIGEVEFEEPEFEEPVEEPVEEVTPSPPAKETPTQATPPPQREPTPERTSPPEEPQEGDQAPSGEQPTEVQGRTTTEPVERSGTSMVPTTMVETRRSGQSDEAEPPSGTEQVPAQPSPQN
jgi:protein phosphatase